MKVFVVLRVGTHLAVQGPWPKNHQAFPGRRATGLGVTLTLQPQNHASKELCQPALEKPPPTLPKFALQSSPLGLGAVSITIRSISTISLSSRTSIGLAENPSSEFLPRGRHHSSPCWWGTLAFMDTMKARIAPPASASPLVTTQGQLLSSQPIPSS